MNLEKIRAYFPIAAGALSTFFMLQLSDAAPTGTLYVLWISEIPYFVLAALIGCVVAPKRPWVTALFVLVGVSIGVLFDVFFHPNDARGYERNLFPIEVVFHTIFAIPAVLSVSLVIQLLYFFYQKSKKV